MEFVLASASPRRKELLQLLGIDFSIEPSDVDETLVKGLTPHQQVERLALKKAQALPHADKTIIGSDTIVVQDGVILGKPVDEKDAIQMLKQLSGKSHQVMTAVAVINRALNIETSFVNVTDVHCHPVDQIWIQEYVKTGHPLDKAGSYGIQGKGFELVEKINGDFYSVMGLPIAQLARLLKSLSLK